MIRRWDKSRPPRGPFALNRDCIQAQGLAAWYPESRTYGFRPDLAGNAHLGNGISPTMAAGKFGEPVNAFASASSQFLSYTGTPVVTYPVTAMVRFNPVTLVTSWLLGGSDGTIFYWGAVLLNTGAVRAQQSSQSADTTATVAAGTWNTVISRFGGATDRGVTLNQDAEVTNANNDPDNPFAAANNVRMGALALGGTILLTNSLIGESAIWNIGLSAAVRAILNDPGHRYELAYPLRSRRWISMPSAPATAGGGVFPWWLAHFGAGPVFANGGSQIGL